MPQHGYAPYEESAFRSALRLLAAGARGAVSAPAGGGLLGGFFSGYDASARASEEAQRAAQAYAQKQQEMEDRRLHQEMQRKFMEAQIAQISKEKTPPPPPTDLYRDADDETFNRVVARKAAEREAIEKVAARYRPKPQQKDATPAKPKVTPGERTSLGYFNRARAAEETISGLEDKIARMTIGDQTRLRFAPNVFQSSEMQIYRQAQRAFTEARLRKESGAAIPPHEYTNDSKTYFAEPGDTPATVRAKKAARQVVLESLKFSSGGAYNEYYGGVESETADEPDLIYNPETGELEPVR